MKEKYSTIFLLSVLLFWACSGFSSGKTYYVAKNGKDSNSGSKRAPFATVAKAHGLAMPGDTIYIRGGKYLLASSIVLSKKGTPRKHINLFAYPGETPILNGSKVKDEAVIVFKKTAYWHVKGLEICYSNRSKHTWGIKVDNESHHNLLEMLNIHHNCGAGLIVLGTYNVILNCDSHHNWDNADGADGFTVANPLAKNNLIKGCRAWQNCDDGFDAWRSVKTTFENCWAFKGGYNDKGEKWTPKTDGNGFKLGKGVGKHTVKNCLAWNNLLFGFDYNKGKIISLFNCTAWDNGASNFEFTLPTHKITNCVSFGKGMKSFNADQKNNNWNLGITVGKKDFVSMDYTKAMGPRKPDGSLPDFGFMQPVRGSALIDKGGNVGLPYKGKAPDLGAYEF